MKFKVHNHRTKPSRQSRDKKKGSIIIATHFTTYQRGKLTNCFQSQWAENSKEIDMFRFWLWGSWILFPCSAQSHLKSSDWLGCFSKRGNSQWWEKHNPLSGLMRSEMWAVIQRSGTRITSLCMKVVTGVIISELNTSKTMQGCVCLCLHEVCVQGCCAVRTQCISCQHQLVSTSFHTQTHPCNTAYVEDAD